MIALLAGLLMIGSLGCNAFGSSKEMRLLREQVAAQKQQNAALEERIIALQRTLDEQKQQITTLQTLGADRLAMLVAPVRLELERTTGGYDEDGRPGDDGVVAYVRPIDDDGDVVKVAGVLVMDVFDLTGVEPRLVAHAELDAANTRKAWHGRLWTQHFTIQCPWPPPGNEPPPTRELTVRVLFTDLLTGRTLTAQRAVTIKLPADVKTAAAP